MDKIIHFLEIKIIVVLILLFIISGCNNKDLSKLGGEYIEKGYFKNETLSDLAGIKLPNEIKMGNIAFYVGGTQDLELFISSKVSHTKIDQCIESICKINETRSLVKIDTAKKSVSEALPTRIPDSLKPLTWWKVNEIKKGFYIGQKDAYILHIWYDEEYEILYIYSTD